MKFPHLLDERLTEQFDPHTVTSKTIIRSGNASPPSETKMTEPSNDTRGARSSSLRPNTYTHAHARARHRPSARRVRGDRWIDIHPSKLAEHLCAFKASGKCYKVAHLAQSCTFAPLVSREHSKSWRETIMASRCRGELRATRSPRISR